MKYRIIAYNERTKKKYALNSLAGREWYVERRGRLAENLYDLIDGNKALSRQEKKTEIAIMEKDSVRYYSTGWFEFSLEEE